MTDDPKPNLTADAVVLTGTAGAMRVLVIRRKKPPFEGAWAFPGGFIEAFELPLAAAIRECQEETGIRLSVGDAIPLEIRGRKERDPRGWTVSQPYLFWVSEPAIPAAADDAAEARWHPLDRLPRLAFDHGAILCEALGKFWPMMPGFDRRLSEIEPWRGVPPMNSDLVFFGGSFNPWHDGHSACLASYRGDGTLIVVPDRNPEKSLTNPPCFWQVFRHLCDVSAPAGAHVFPGFLGLERRNPTVAWLPLVTASSRALLLGADSFVRLHTWIDADSLVASIDQIFVVPRNASAQEIRQATSWVQERNRRCAIALLPDHPYQHLSSSQLRRDGHASH